MEKGQVVFVLIGRQIGADRWLDRMKGGTFENLSCVSDWSTDWSCQDERGVALPNSQLFTNDFTLDAVDNR